MKDNTIYFRIGEENKPVVETSHFENSIFIHQYRTALEIANRYLQNSSNQGTEEYDAFQGLAFCGERGDGKTSAMLSFLNILKVSENDKSNENKDRKRFIEESLGKDSYVIKQKTIILDLIDPTQFVNYNIIEVILSQLFNQLIDLKSSCRDRYNSLHYNDILVDFQEVKRSIELLGKKDNSIFDALEDFNELSDAVKLKSRIHSLIRNFLSIQNASHLIIPIDDVDLQMKGVYEMVERLRKYFALPEVIVVMAIKPTQLFAAIEHALRISVGNDEKSFSETELETMTEKYLIKFLPQNCRVHMPTVDGIFDRRLEIRDKNGERVIYRNRTFKDGVLELIFIKTRYLFYNSLGEISTLFPKNLRELFHLLGQVAEMKMPTDNGDDTHRLNQSKFKNYFFGIWTESLKKEFRIKAKEWSGSISDNTLNKEVVAFLSFKFNNYLHRKISAEIEGEESEKEEDEKSKTFSDIEDSILADLNYTYNVSVGDVFYILDIIEREIMPDEDYRFIFFVRSLYSIKLYDKYDFITHNRQVFLTESPSGGIYRNDERFSNVNLMQRLVGGSFFTFAPGSYISYKYKDALVPCDRRIIKGKDGLNILIEDVVKEKGEDIQKMKLAEFLILTVSHYVTNKDKMSSANMMTFPVEFMKKARESSAPIAFSKFSSQRGYYEFNILAPFANIINIKYAYERFYKGEELFDIALRNEHSLLCSMWKEAYLSRGFQLFEWIDLYCDTIESLPKETPYDTSTNEMLSKNMGQLLSDGIIRNAEVMVALADRFKLIGKEITRSGSNSKLSNIAKTLSKIRTFYNKIVNRDSAMSTHRFRFIDIENDTHTSRHRISFQYFSALSDFLGYLEHLDSLDDDNPDKEPLKFFSDIFDWIVETKEIKNDKSKEDEKLISELKKIIGYLFSSAVPLKGNKKSGFDLFNWAMVPEATNDYKRFLAMLNEIDSKVNYDLWNKDVTLHSWRERIEKNYEDWRTILMDAATKDYIKTTKEYVDVSTIDPLF